MPTKARKAKPDYSTTLGIGVALALVLFSIAMTDNWLGFINLPSFLIVVLGTLSVTTACFSWQDMVALVGSLRKTVFKKFSDPKRAANHVIDLAEYAKKKGLLALNEKENEMEEGSVLLNGARMLIDGIGVEDAEHVLRQDIEGIVERNERAAALLKKAAEIAPAMGLIGTLIGLVQMLGQLEDPAGIGAPMALALLTTLYGALFAYVVLTPLASKVETNSEEELMLNKIYLTAISCIGKMENPRKLETLLNTILPPAKRLNRYK